MGTLATCYEPAEPMLATRTRQPETKPRSCGSQPAHESLFNRRLWSLPPAVCACLFNRVPVLPETRVCVPPLDCEHESRLLKKGARRRLATVIH